MHEPAAPSASDDRPTSDAGRAASPAAYPAAVAAGAAPPGATPYDATLQADLSAAWQARDAGYQPRTRHLQPDGGPLFTNRLFLQTSPYLRQHAHNPVDWHPWGDEAFEEARRLGRPVLLSVGYSTCHWCHVMEEESFEDVEIATYINEHYVAVKVDREERPDIDGIYMAAVQAMTRRGGGWPMTVWLTPDRQPFHAATYIPPRDGVRGVQHGFLTLLAALQDVYAKDPAKIRGAAEHVTTLLEANLKPPPPSAVPGPEALDVARRWYLDRYDADLGGLKRAPKFPSSFPIRLLLSEYARAGSTEARDAAHHTLLAMGRGGMRDQLGGGFHRYSVDAEWLVPHFEVMLYDQALLVLDYLAGWQATGDPELAAVAHDVLRHVSRAFAAPGGGFFSATDADSLTPSGHREEGWFFTWTPDELEAVLGADDAAFAATLWGVQPGGNFEGRSILHLDRGYQEHAAALGMGLDALHARRRAVVDELLQARSQRPAPLLDDKRITAWNGLMLGAFARAGFVLARPDYLQIARDAGEAAWRDARVDGRLRRTVKDGVARHDGMLEDHAFLAFGYLELFEATGEAVWIQRARELDALVEERFEDREDGGWWTAPKDGEALLVRQKPTWDGAVPTGGSVHTLNLLRLALLTGEDPYRARAVAALEAMGGVLRDSPVSVSELLHALTWQVGSPLEIVVVAPPGTDPSPLLDVVRTALLPAAVLIPTTPGAAAVPLADKPARDGLPTAYVCELGSCKAPTTDPAVLAAQLEALGARRP